MKGEQDFRYALLGACITEQTRPFLPLGDARGREPKIKGKVERVDK